MLLLCLTFLSLWLGQAAQAQAISLPLSSVGREVGWFTRNGGDDYHLAVFERAANQPLLLELYSPEVNLNDYANQRNITTYYGDETYGKNIAMRTDFSLLSREGGQIASRSFGSGSQHGFDSLYSGTLAQGFYPLMVNTFGNGKNAFGFRTPAGVAVEASQFTVVTRGQYNRDQLAARLTLNSSAIGKEFRLDNFDADGVKEMAIFALLPGNKRVRLTPSEDVQWATNAFRVTPEMVGEWAILVRILPTTKQFSNSVTFRMRLDEQPYFARMPSFEGYSPKGSLEVGAVAQVCGQSLALEGVGFSVAGIRQKTPAALNLTAGNYTVQGAALAGSETPSVNIAIKDGETTYAKLIYSVMPTLRLEPAQLQLQEGQSAELKAIVSSPFPYELGYKVELSSSGPITLTPGAPLRGVVGPDKPLAIPIEVKANQAGQAKLMATLTSGCAAAQMPITVEPLPVIALPVIKEPEVDLVLNKTVNVSQVLLAQPAVYTLTVSNNSPDTATGVTLVDELPAGLKLDSATGNPSISGNRLVWELATLSKGERHTFSVRTIAVREGRWINSASVKAKETETDLSTNRSTAPLEVLAPPTPEVLAPPTPKVLAPQPPEAKAPPKEPQVDLSLSKSVSPNQITVGETTTYTLVVQNNGPDTATQVELSDTLPAGASLVWATPTAARVDGSLVWNLGNLGVGESRTVHVQVRADAAGSLVNTAAVKSGQTETYRPNNQASVALEVKAPPPPQVDVAVSQTVSEASVRINQDLTYTLTVVNHGPNTATNLILLDELPAGLSYRDSNPKARANGNLLSWNLGSLASGQSKTLTVSVNARQAGLWINGVSVKAQEDDPTPDNNRSEIGVEVGAPPPPPLPKPQADLAVGQSLSAVSLAKGQGLTYTLTVSNNGPDAATKVILTDQLPAGISYTRSEPQASRSGNTLTWNLGTVLKGESKTFTVSVIAAEVGRWVNTVSVTTSEDETSLSNNRVEAAVEVLAPPVKHPEADLSIIKTVSAATVRVGTHVSYTLSVLNHGPDAASGVVLVDYLPEGLRLVSASISPSQANNTLTWNLGTLAKGEGKTIVVQAKAMAVGQWLNVATAGALEVEPNLSNSRAEAGIEVLPVRVDLALSKTVAPAQVMVGEEAVYTLNVSNNGPDVATEVVLSDLLPTGLTLLQASPEAILSPQGLGWKLGSLAKGESRSLSVKVRADVPGSLVNRAWVKAKEDEVNTGDNNTASATLEVGVPPKPARLPPQERESQVLLVVKLGQQPPGLVVLSDKMPAEASYIPGSSLRLNNPAAELGDAIPDPIQIGDRLYWMLPSGHSGYAIRYRLAHTGMLQMPADHISIMLALPQVRSAELPRTAAIDGALGQVLGLGELRLIQGSPEALSRLQGAKGSEGLGVLHSQQLGGAVSRIEVEPIRLLNDATSQPALLIRASDAAGLAANDEWVTLEVDPEPASPDASPEQPGYQARLINGQALVRLSDLAGQAGDTVAPKEVTVEARINGLSSSARFRASQFSVVYLEPSLFAITPAQRPWIMSGAAGVQINIPLGGSVPFSIGASSQAFARGPVLGDVLLTLAYNLTYDSALGNFKATNLMPPANPYERFPLLGDSSRLGSDVRSFDAFYLKLEKDDDYLLYGQLAPGFSGLLSAYNPEVTGVQAVVRDGSFSLSAFVTPTPNANVREFFRGDGTGFYKLRGTASTLSNPSLSSVGSNVVGVKESSEQVKVLVYDRFNPNLKLSERELRRLADYDVDYSSGRVLLSKPLSAVDANGNPQFLEVAYALETSARRDWLAGSLRYGAQAEARMGGFSIGATYLKFDPSQEAYIGAKAGFELGSLQVDAELGFSGAGGQGIMASAAQASYNSERLQFGVRYQDKGLKYVEPSTGLLTPGRDIAAEVGLKITGSLSLNANYSLRDTLTVSTQAASIEARNDFGGVKVALGAAFELGAFNKTWITGGLELPLGNFSIGALQKIGLGSTNAETILSLDYAISKQFGLRLSDTLVWVNGLNRMSHQANLGVRGSFRNSELLRTLLGNESETPETFGSTNFSASYDLTSADGQAGRARVGLDTELPLSDNLSTQLGGEYITSAQSEANFNLGLLYKGEGSKASARAQFSVQPAGIKGVFTAAGLFQLSPDFALSPSAEYTALPGGNSGGKFSLAAAYRGDDLSLITNNRLRLGQMYTAANSELDGELRLAYETGEVWFIRAGVAYKLSDNVFTGQVGAGTTWYLLNNLGLEAGASYLFSGNTSSALLLGIGANLRLAPGLALGVGFNFETFAVGVTNYLDARPGLYLRMDWKFDERSFGQ